MEVLLHTCCAPCSVKCIDILENENFKPVLFWYNPNIHPYTEYKSRRNTLKEYANEKGFEAIIKDEYGLREFINLVYPDFENRCEKCYRVRLEDKEILRSKFQLLGITSLFMYSSIVS